MSSTVLSPPPTVNGMNTSSVLRLPLLSFILV
jgi:hypothetical protein